MEWVDFRSLKQTVSIEQVLEHYGIALKPSGPNVLRGACPLPTHSSDSSEMSFMADRRKNVWVCHSQSCVGARQGANRRATFSILSVSWKRAPCEPQGC